MVAQQEPGVARLVAHRHALAAEVVVAAARPGSPLIVVIDVDGRSDPAGVSHDGEHAVAIAALRMAPGLCFERHQPTPADERGGCSMGGPELYPLRG